MTDINETKKKSFWFFDGSDFFEFLRRTMSLISPSMVVVFMLSLGAFFSKDKFGSDSYQYKVLIGGIVVFIALIIVAIFHDLHKNYSKVNLNYLCKVIIGLATIYLSGAIIYVSVINAASMHSLIMS
ncbi:Uncharacterised protein [Proteus vulgaris]|uniref:hypothetical protein n=1 Tax=Proteus vulgaris TaxID=585 RepID=UPI000DFAC932|nr:hypothetical protein [Proteus vulgaris]SUC13747.1 Uncharacterised protein [Proteus vulgaris]